MNKVILTTLACYMSIYFSNAQTVLSADGLGETYELINSVFAPGADVVEVPDCIHTDFGRHIEEVMDTELNQYVFRFLIHVTPDNDRCKKDDRQRVEIKTYDKSPDELLGVIGEEVVYKWKFKLDEGFQPSSKFTHIHQLKAVGGPEDGMPLITFTARKSSPNRLELRYAEALVQKTLTQVELSGFLGEWVEVTERVVYGDNEEGQYALSMVRLSDEEELLNYQVTTIRMWKTEAAFIRPKWGIYRSLDDQASLRDEEVLFADISIEEIEEDIVDPPLALKEELAFQIYPNPASDVLIIATEQFVDSLTVKLYNASGSLVLSQTQKSNQLVVGHLDNGLYVMVLSNKSGVISSQHFLKR